MPEREARENGRPSTTPSNVLDLLRANLQRAIRRSGLRSGLRNVRNRIANRFNNNRRFWDRRRGTAPDTINTEDTSSVPTTSSTIPVSSEITAKNSPPEEHLPQDDTVIPGLSLSLSSSSLTLATGEVLGEFMDQVFASSPASRLGLNTLRTERDTLPGERIQASPPQRLGAIPGLSPVHQHDPPAEPQLSSPLPHMQGNAGQDCRSRLRITVPQLAPLDLPTPVSLDSRLTRNLHRHEDNTQDPVHESLPEHGSGAGRPSKGSIAGSQRGGGGSKLVGLWHGQVAPAVRCVKAHRCPERSRRELSVELAPTKNNTLDTFTHTIDRRLLPRGSFLDPVREENCPLLRGGASTPEAFDYIEDDPESDGENESQPTTPTSNQPTTVATHTNGSAISPITPSVPLIRLVNSGSEVNGRRVRRVRSLPILPSESVFTRYDCSFFDLHVLCSPLPPLHPHLASALASHNNQDSTVQAPPAPEEDTDHTSGDESAESDNTITPKPAAEPYAKGTHSRSSSTEGVAGSDSAAGTEWPHASNHSQESLATLVSDTPPALPQITVTPATPPLRRAHPMRVYPGFLSHRNLPAGMLDGRCQNSNNGVNNDNDDGNDNSPQRDNNNNNNSSDEEGSATDLLNQGPSTTSARLKKRLKSILKLKKSSEESEAPRPNSKRERFRAKCTKLRRSVSRRARAIGDNIAEMMVQPAFSQAAFMKT